MTSTPAEPRGPLAPLPEDATALRRLIVALTADEIGRQRGRPVAPAEWRLWSDATRLDEDGVGADSLARLELATRLDAFFHLHDSGVEDYLPLAPTLGDWREIVAAGLRLSGRRVGFRTSGATGAPKPIAHAALDLAAEAEAHARLLSPARRVLALVPPHHIYGFLFTVLGPARLGTPVEDARASTPGAVAAAARAGDRVVATPFLWDLIARSGARFARGVEGVVSTAPCPPELWAALRALGLGRLVEIYGSTETAGLGWRDSPDAGFALLPHLVPGPESGGILRRRDGAPLAPPDRLLWGPDGRFAPAGRADGAVQVGGVNVFPERVRAVLLEHAEVADCVVRAGGGGAARLKAFVVPAAPAAPDALADRLARHCLARLSAPERPVRFDFGEALPRNEMGKPADW